MSSESSSARPPCRSSGGRCRGSRPRPAGPACGPGRCSRPPTRAASPPGTCRSRCARQPPCPYPPRSSLLLIRAWSRSSHNRGRCGQKTYNLGLAPRRRSTSRERGGRRLRDARPAGDRHGRHRRQRLGPAPRPRAWRVLGVQHPFPYTARAASPGAKSGASRNRTGDLLGASETLSQLSYGPRHSIVRSSCRLTEVNDHRKRPARPAPATAIASSRSITHRSSTARPLSNRQIE